MRQWMQDDSESETPGIGLPSDAARRGPCVAASVASAHPRACQRVAAECRPCPQDLMSIQSAIPPPPGSRIRPNSVANIRRLPDPEGRHTVSKTPAGPRQRPRDQRAKLLRRVRPPDRLAPIQHIHSRQAQRRERGEQCQRHTMPHQVQNHEPPASPTDIPDHLDKLLIAQVMNQAYTHGHIGPRQSLLGDGGTYFQNMDINAASLEAMRHAGLAGGWTRLRATPDPWSRQAASASLQGVNPTFASLLCAPARMPPIT